MVDTVESHQMVDRCRDRRFLSRAWDERPAIRFSTAAARVEAELLPLAVEWQQPRPALTSSSVRGEWRSEPSRWRPHDAITSKAEAAWRLRWLRQRSCVVPYDPKETYRFTVPPHLTSHVRVQSLPDAACTVLQEGTDSPSLL